MTRILRAEPCTYEPTRLVEVASGSAVASVSTVNLASLTTPSMPECGSWVCWSGWLGESDPQRGWYERVPGQWLGSSQDAWTRVESVLDRAGGAVLRPHARHLVSDGPTCLNWLRGRPDRKLLLDPVAMLEPEMLEAGDDHIERVLEMVGPLAWGVVVCDVQVREEPARSAWCVPAPAGKGRLDMQRFVENVRTYVGDEAMLVGLCDADVALLSR